MRNIVGVKEFSFCCFVTSFVLWILCICVHLYSVNWIKCSLLYDHCHHWHPILLFQTWRAGNGVFCWRIMGNSVSMSAYECCWEDTLIFASYRRCFMSVLTLSSGMHLSVSKTIILTLHVSPPTTLRHLWFHHESPSPVPCHLADSIICRLPACLPLWLREEQRHLFQRDNKQSAHLGDGNWVWAKHTLCFVDFTKSVSVKQVIKPVWSLSLPLKSKCVSFIKAQSVDVWNCEPNTDLSRGVIAIRSALNHSSSLTCIIIYSVTYPLCFM